MPVYLIISIILIIVAVIFAVQNASLVPVTFLIWDFEGSLVLILLLFFAAGVAIGILSSIPKFLKKNRDMKHHKRHIEHLEEKLQERKNSAIIDDNI